jgi:hypothetical protein
MFDTTFNAIAAFQQMMFFVAGLPLVALGMFFVIYALYWFIYARRVPAIVIGVRKKGSIIYPVYRYAMPDGNIYETTSDTGSNLLRGKETGRPVVLRVFEDDPTEVRSDILGMIFLGLLFTLPGAFFIFKALTSYDFTSMTLVAVIVFGFVCIRRLYLMLRKQGNTSGFATWRQQIKQKRRHRPVNDLPLQTLEEYQQTPAGKRQRALLHEANRTGGPILGGIGLAMILFGLYIGNHTQALALYGVKTQGIVTELKTNGSDAAYPVVTFKTNTGDTVHFQSKLGAAPSPYHVKDAVKVHYMAQDPAGTAEIADSAQSFVLLGILLIGGTIFLLSGLAAFYNYRRDQRAMDEGIS